MAPEVVVDGFDADPGSLPLSMELTELYKELRGIAGGGRRPS